MPRRKTYKIAVKDTNFHSLLVSELQMMNPELAAEFDMVTLEISVKKKPKPQINNIDRVIETLESHLPTYRNEIGGYKYESFVNKNDIALLLGISRPTLDKWIREGFIKPVQSKYLPEEYFYTPEEILKQLLKIKNQK